MPAATDVKELVPEFYSSPEFLLNSNRFSLGMKQASVQLHLGCWMRAAACIDCFALGTKQAST